jgi:hypothetical protein
MPLLEFCRIASSLLLIWGTYVVVWKELEHRFPKKQRGYWWFAAKMAMFVTGLMAAFYCVLYFALSILWMEFLSLNTIADVATKRTAFEIAMTAFFFGYGLLTVSASTATVVMALLRDGKVQGVSTHRPERQSIPSESYILLTYAFRPRTALFSGSAPSCSWAGQPPSSGRQ